MIYLAVGKPTVQTLHALSHLHLRGELVRATE